MTISICLSGIIAYSLFWWWYVGLPKKIAPAEADRFYDWAVEQGVTEQRAEGLRDFFAKDDGRDFVMINLIELNKPVRESSHKLAQYQKIFLGQLLRRAGHPVFVAQRSGANVEHVNCETNSRWPAMGAIRYRSRRDLLELLPATIGGEHHQLKLDAVASTIGFPASKWFMLGGPKVTAALLTLSLVLILELVI